MLTITIPGDEFYDEDKEEFIVLEPKTINLEHSLISISKWESKWCKPFMSSTKTNIELLDYVKNMTLNDNISDDVYYRLTSENVNDINNYIEAPMTATTFKETKGGGNKEIITSELIYYWLVSFNIPIECEKWHINRLLTLIKVCNIKNAPPEKVNRQEIIRRNKQLNAERRKQLETTG